jgi:hypothetical protein
MALSQTDPNEIFAFVRSCTNHDWLRALRSEIDARLLGVAQSTVPILVGPDPMSNALNRDKAREEANSPAFQQAVLNEQDAMAQMAQRAQQQKQMQDKLRAQAEKEGGGGPSHLGANIPDPTKDLARPQATAVDLPTTVGVGTVADPGENQDEKGGKDSGAKAAASAEGKKGEAAKKAHGKE